MDIYNIYKWQIKKYVVIVSKEKNELVERLMNKIIDINKNI